MRCSRPLARVFTDAKLDIIYDIGFFICNMKFIIHPVLQQILQLKSILLHQKKKLCYFEPK